MALYAIIESGSVADIVSVPAGQTLSDLTFLTPAQVAAVVAVPTGTQVALGWGYNGSAWTPRGGPPPPPTLAQQAMAALYRGLTVTLAGTMTLAATVFPLDPVTQAKLTSIIAMINATGEFPGGVSTFPMKDMAGTWHTFDTVAQYKAVAVALGGYGASLWLIIDGNPFNETALPISFVLLTV